MPTWLLQNNCISGGASLVWREGGGHCYLRGLPFGGGGKPPVNMFSSMAFTGNETVFSRVYKQTKKQGRGINRMFVSSEANFGGQKMFVCWGLSMGNKPGVSPTC